jgi:hypothetical protein
MFRKTMIVLATAAVFSGGVTADAVARATGHTGWWSRRRGRTRYRPEARAQAAAQRTQIRPVGALGRLPQSHDCKPFLSSG